MSRAAAMARRRSKAYNSEMHSVVPDGYDQGESIEMAPCNVPGLHTQVSPSSTLACRGV